MTRKEAREELFILVFEYQFKNDTAQEILECAKETRDLPEEEYILSVFQGICQKQDEIDKIISDNAKGWSLQRISKVALAAMRIAIYEMLYRDDIPVGVSVNEAVEIIKKYALNADASFANGILGTVARSLV